ncbi:MAG: hypothetical protein PHV18_05070 [Lachnospiraceae bacterium]|nr:hypothetical protein [Lachnospiraceae bacterium]
MATIQTALQLYDGMTGPLKSISNAMNIVINTFEAMQTTSAHPIDTAALQTARSELGNVNMAVVEMEKNIQAAANKQDGFNQKIREGQGAATGLGGKIKQMVGAYAGVRGIRMGVQFVADTISLQNVQNEAETKLGAIMQQRMGASPAEIQSIKALTAAQQGLGVVGDEVQLSGAQQLATFINSSDALSTLIPAMNNLAVQQNGVNVNTQDAINIGNMMGKVMQGQVGALTRVGVTFTDAQEQVLKYGNEQERAAMLAQVITDNVSNMNEIMASTPQGQIQQMANTWGDIKETIGAKLYPAVMRFFKALNSNMPQAENLIMGVAGALNVVITVLSWLVDGVGAVVGFFQSNWSMIEPIIWGIVGALTIYYLYLGYTKAALVIGAVAEGAMALAKGIHALAIWATTRATWAQVTAQMGLNGAMYACPLVWIIGLVILLVGVFYAAVAAVSHLAGTSISATGLICGAIAAAGAFIINIFIGLWNGLVGIVVDLINVCISFAEFFANFLNNPVLAIMRLIADLANFVIGVMQSLAKVIDTVFGSNLSGIVSGWASSVESFKNGITTDSTITYDRITKGDLQIDRLNYGDAWDAGNAFGKGIDAKVKALFDGKGFSLGDGYGAGGSSAQDAWDNIGGNTGNTAGNTARMADSMDMAEEDLQSMRDMAEAEVINRFTAAELTVNMGGITNQVNSQMDLDGIGSYLEEQIFGVLETAAEGVY